MLNPRLKQFGFRCKFYPNKGCKRRALLRGKNLANLCSSSFFSTYFFLLTKGRLCRLFVDRSEEFSEKGLCQKPQMIFIHISQLIKSLYLACLSLLKPLKTLFVDKSGGKSSSDYCLVFTVLYREMFLNEELSALLCDTIYC